MEALAIDVVVRGTALLALIFGLVAALRGASAATRHLAWSFGMVGLLALPILAALLPWRLEIVPAGFSSLLVSSPIDDARVEWALEGEAGTEIAPVTVIRPSAHAARLTGSTSGISPSLARSSSEHPIVAAAPVELFVAMGGASDAAVESSDSSGQSGVATAELLLPALLAAWLAGALLVLGRLLTGQVALWWLARRARPLDDPAWSETAREVAARLGIENAVRILRSDRVAIPLTSGLIRPLVLLPPTAESWSVERRRAVLLHELAHVSRRDLLTHWLAWAACALYWFHPLVWIAARRLRSESERACDDLVLRLGPRASEYARHLIQIVRAAGPSPAPAAVLPLARRSDLEGRVTAILRTGVRRHGRTFRGAAPVGLAVLLFTVPVAAMSPAGGESPAADLEEARPSETVPVPPPGIWQDEGQTPGKHEVYDQDLDSDEEGSGLIRLLRDHLVQASVDLEGIELRVLSAEDGEAVKLEIGGFEVEIGAEGEAVELPEGQEGKGQDVTGRAVTLIAAGSRDGKPEVRLAAVAALGELDDPRAVAALSKALREDPDPEVRRMAAWALGELEDPRGVPALVEALRTDQSDEVRSTAAWALGEIEDEAAVAGLGEALRDENVEIRRKAAWALGEIESSQAVDALMVALEDSDVEVRRTAVWALGEIEDAAAVPALQMALDDADVEIRRKAAWALGEIESSEAVAALSAAIEDGDAEVRLTAVWALGEIEDPAAVPALVRVLQDSDVEIRQKAAWALAEIESPAAIEALSVALEDSDVDVRRFAALALGEIEDGAAVPALKGALDDPDADVRRAAAYALAEIETPAAIEALVPLLESDDPEIRKMAIQAIAENQ